MIPVTIAGFLTLENKTSLIKFVQDISWQDPFTIIAVIIQTQHLWYPTQRTPETNALLESTLSFRLGHTPITIRYYMLMSHKGSSTSVFCVIHHWKGTHISNSSVCNNHYPSFFVQKPIHCFAHRLQTVLSLANLLLSLTNLTSTLNKHLLYLYTFLHNYLLLGFISILQSLHYFLRSITTHYFFALHCW
jgi:hypothetical protein